MTLDKTKKYAGRFGDKDSNSPTGSYKNKTDSSTNDGSFLEQDWANDAYDGLNGAFLANVHDASTGEPTGYLEPTFPVTLNENVDNAQSSQVYNAWYKKTNDIVDAKIAELITLSEGCWFNYYSVDLTASNPTTATVFDFDVSNAIYNGNNISIDLTDTDTINIAKAGTYLFKPSFYTVGLASTSQSDFSLDLSTDNGTNYTPFVEKIRTVPFGIWDLQESTYQSSRATTAFISSNLSTWAINVGMSGAEGNSIVVLVPQNNTKLQVRIKIGDGSTGLDYRFGFGLHRIGKCLDVNDYMPPIDMMNS